jgi:uncharacterized membrane protein
MEHLCHKIALVVATIGLAVILIGTIRCTIRFILIELKSPFKMKPVQKLDILRGDLGAYLLLGLEFSVGADIILTLIEPNYEGLIILGSLVIMRTVISYFVGKEREELRKELKESS